VVCWHGKHSAECRRAEQHDSDRRLLHGFTGDAAETNERKASALVCCHRDQVDRFLAHHVIDDSRHWRAKRNAHMHLQYRLVE